MVVYSDIISQSKTIKSALLKFILFVFVMLRAVYFAILQFHSSENRSLLINIIGAY